MLMTYCFREDNTTMVPDKRFFLGQLVWFGFFFFVVVFFFFFLEKTSAK